MNDDAILDVLSHSRRREILKHIVRKGEPVRAAQVARELEGRSDNVTYHFHVLRDAGVLVVVDEPAEGSKRRYYFADKTVTDTAWVRQVLGLPPVDAEGR